MREKSPAGNCFCSLWDTSPQFLEEQGLPRGYCGFCDMCGDPGHGRHFPGPVPVTGAWCDICYRIQAHKGPIRAVGAWYFDASDGEEQSIEYDGNAARTLHSLLYGLRTPKSALIVELPSKTGIDFFVKKNGLIDMEYSDPRRGLWGEGEVDLGIAELALSTLLNQGNFRQVMLAAGIQLEYYEEEPDSGE